LSLPAAVDAQLFSFQDAKPLKNLRQLHVITRHGSRMPLTKDSDNLAELPEGPPLTATGEKELYDLGLWIRNRYAGATPGLFRSYNHRNVHLESSALDRTIVSANALALGLFGDAARDPYNENLLSTTRPNIPVYMKDLSNDVDIRAYEKCDTFHDRLLDLYENNNEWNAMEETYGTLLRKLANVPQFQQYVVESKIPLEELWNIYDTVMVAKTECVNATAPTCLNLPDPTLKDALGEDHWRDLQTLAHKAELLKYSQQTAGTLVGGNLGKKIIDRMIVQQNQIGTAGDEAQFFLYSAHYPTLLGVIAALNEEPFDGETIPGYGAALIFELYANTVTGGDHLVQLHYKPADIEKPITFKDSCLDPDAAVCPLHREWMKFAQAYSVEDWCRDCGNKEADVCLQQLASSSSSSCSSSSSKVNQPALAGTLIGLVIGGLLTLLGNWCSQRRRQRKAQASEQSIKPPSLEDTSSTSVSFA